MISASHVYVPVVADQFEWPFVEPHRVDMVVNGLYLEALDVPTHPIHQLRPLHAFGVARPVVYVGRRSQLPADLDAGDHQRIQIRTRCIERCGIAGRT